MIRRGVVYIYIIYIPVVRSIVLDIDVIVAETNVISEGSVEVISGALIEIMGGELKAQPPPSHATDQLCGFTEKAS